LFFGVSLVDDVGVWAGDAIRSPSYGVVVPAWVAA